MRKIAVAICISLLLAAVALSQEVTLVRNDAERRVDVTVDGKPFTSYRWDERVFRLVLYPIISSGGSYVTRGFPFETRDGDTVDHPHQVGCSLSYGSVNGIDYWNSSTFRTADEMKKMGKIVHSVIVSIKSGKGVGELLANAKWIDSRGSIVLKERTKYSFHASGSLRWIDRETSLTANGEDVAFGDSKEGMFAIHLSSELEQNDQTNVKVSSAKGVIGQREDTRILSGIYSSSDGLTTEQKIWGTRSKWAMVSGNIGDEKVAVAMFDHPSNQGFPSRLMARGYGLLALNPFGQKQYDPKLPEQKFVLKRGDSVTFRYRLLIASGEISNEDIENAYKKFAQ